MRGAVAEVEPRLVGPRRGRPGLAAAHAPEVTVAGDGLPKDPLQIGPGPLQPQFAATADAFQELPQLGPPLLQQVLDH